MMRAALLLLLLVPTAVFGQSLRVRITDAESGRAVAGALVSALGDGATAGAAVLSGPDGGATVAIGTARQVRVLVRRIGFAPFTSTPITVDGAPVPVPIAIPSQRFALAAVRVMAKRTCDNTVPSPSVESRPIWDEVRQALESSELARKAGATTMYAMRIDRRFDKAGVLTSIDTVSRGLSGDQPFVAAAPEVLAREGYVTGSIRAGYTFNAPDERVLLDESFALRHCIALEDTRRRGDGGLTLIIGFEPRLDSPAGDIRGTVEVDSASHELRRLDFAYVNPRLPVRVDSIGGSVRFARTTAGGWYVSDWTIRMPAWRTAVTTTRNSVFPSYVLNGYRESVGTASPSTATADMRGVIRGVVFDSLNGGALSGATVRLVATNEAALTDASGRFRFDSVPAGVHVLWIDHPRLDSLDLPSLGAQFALGAGRDTTITVGIAAFPKLWQAFCQANGSGAAPRAGDGILLGRVAPPPSEADSGAVVVARWDRTPADSAGDVRARIGEDATFTLCGVPRDRTMRLGIERPALRSGARTTIGMSLGARPIARRDLTLLPEGVFELPSVDDSTTRVARTGSGVLIGVVRDTSGRARDGARVRVSGISEPTRTDAGGRFLVTNVPPGPRVVWIESVGYEPARTAADFRDGDTVRVDATVRALTRLEAMTIEAEARSTAFRDDLARRMKSGAGYHVDSAAIAKAPSVHSAMMVPSAQVVVRNPMNFVVYFSPTKIGQARCVGQVYLDGILSTWDEASALAKESIGAIEIYPRASDAPQQYIRLRSTCGVVMYWTADYLSARSRQP
jgi:hypothetical protein